MKNIAGKIITGHCTNCIMNGNRTGLIEMYGMKKICACCTNEADAKRREKGGCRGSLLHLPFKQSNHNGVTLRGPNLFWS